MAVISDGCSALLTQSVSIVSSGRGAAGCPSKGGYFPVVGTHGSSQRGGDTRTLYGGGTPLVDAEGREPCLGSDQTSHQDGGLRDW